MAHPFLGGRRLNCRMCSSTSLVRYLDLGHQPPADQFRTTEQISAEPVVLYPLEVYLCEACGLSQLGYVVSPEILYQQDYPYESSTTASGRAHFAAFARSVVSSFGFDSTRLAVDVGSNVGVLLAGFAKEGMRIRGVDPAPHIGSLAEQRGIPPLVGFFSPEIARRRRAADGPAPSIAATNVFRMLRREDEARIHELGRLGAFAAAVERNRDQLRDLLYTLKRDGARLAAVSAPAKGMTLLNYARLGTDVLDFATEKSTLKIGRFTPGGNIPVVGDDELVRRRPGYALLLAWNFATEIMGNLRAYQEQGGRFILPIPEPCVVGGAD